MAKIGQNWPFLKFDGNIIVEIHKMVKNLQFWSFFYAGLLNGPYLLLFDIACRKVAHRAGLRFLRPINVPFSAYWHHLGKAMRGCFWLFSARCVPLEAIWFLGASTRRSPRGGPF